MIQLLDHLVGVFVQNMQKPTDTREPGWAAVRSWIGGAANRIEILPPDPAQRGSVLKALQVTAASAIGAICHETGGVLVDHGWVRVLGGRGTRMAGDLASWNGLGPRPTCKAMPGLLVVAHDAVGGVFAADRGALGPGRNGIYYLCPDTLRWISLHRGYSHFLQWCCTGDIAGFAASFRWEGWEADVARLGPDGAFTTQPPRWTPEGKRPKRANLRPAPMSGLFQLEVETGRQLNP